MNKALIFIIAICILLLPACSEISGPVTEATTLPLSGGYEPNLHASGKEEYDVLIEKYQDRLPDNFVTWESASVWGECYWFTGSMNLDSYIYHILNNEGMDLDLFIRHTPKQITNVIVAPDNLTSMRRLQNSTGKTAVLKRDGYEYRYGPNGGLTGIIWYEDGVQFMLSADELFNYPEDKTDTIIGRLLSADESVANAAFAEIKQNLSE